MNQFKNIHVLPEDWPASVINKMEYAAKEHKRHNNISFKLIEYTTESVIIRITQDKNAAGVYHNQKRLIEIVHETYDRFFPGMKVFVHAIPFMQSPANIVDDKWVNQKMLDTGMRLKSISSDTGIDYTRLSALVTGQRPLSQSMKAMFYFYFKFKEYELKDVMAKL